jgi:hypothetical protein
MPRTIPNAVFGSGDCLLRSSASPAKAAERSDSFGGPESAVAIARHHPLPRIVRANDAEATAFWSQCETSRFVPANGLFDIGDANSDVIRRPGMRLMNGYFLGFHGSSNEARQSTFSSWLSAKNEFI